MKRRDALKRISLGMGYTISAASLVSLASACQTESKTMTWTPSFFTSTEGSAIEELLDIMLPATATPGAKDLELAQLIDIIINDVYKEEDQQKFRKGMTAFFGKIGDEAALKKASRSQLTALLEAESTLSQKEQEDIADLMELKEAPEDAAQNQRYHRYKFLNTFRSLAISSYFSSSSIAMEHLKYNPVPGPYQGCIPLEDVGGTWAL